VAGDILKVYVVRSPRPEYFQATGEERLLIIRPAENPSLVVRILHTDYADNTPTSLSVGTPIGHTVRSGFFEFWTEHHIHVEVRNARAHLLRAKGGLPVAPLTQGSRLLGTLSEKPPRLRIVQANPNYVLVDPVEDRPMTLGPLNGFGCKVGETAGLLDSGLPHYRVGSVHVEREATVSPGEDVVLWGTPIGEVVNCSNGLAIFKSFPVEICLNECVIRGISLYLWVGIRPLIKLIPLRPVSPRWRIGDEATIHMRRTILS
jgi:hypothetical protein